MFLIETKIIGGTMKFITPDMHGILDYTAALALLVAPFILGLESHSVLVHWFSVVAGAALIGYSLLTDYGPSIKGVFSYKMHLILDSVASAAFLILAFGHQGSLLSTAYCLVMGGGVIAVIALSEQPEDQVIEATQ